MYLDDYKGSPDREIPFQKAFSSATAYLPQKLPEDFLIDINTADSSAFQKLPGIGPILSQRIIRYRDALQGFDRVDQIKKVYNLPDSVFENIRNYLYLDSTKREPSVSFEKKTYSQKKVAKNISPEETAPPLPSSFSINTADSAAWESLPGIGPKLAHRIIAYRKLIGFFTDSSQLKKVYGLPEKTFVSLERIFKVGDLTAFTKLDLNIQPEWKLKIYPFWEEGEFDLFLGQRKRLRRIDSWDEVRGLRPETLRHLKLYFFYEFRRNPQSTCP